MDLVLSKSVDVALVCPHCGRPHASSAGRAGAVRCACGQVLEVGSPAPGGPTPGSLRPPPIPTRARSLPASAYDPEAAHHGLLIDKRQARALAAPDPFLVPEIDDGELEAVDEAPPTPRPPESAADRDEPPRGSVSRRPTARRSRLVLRAAVILALLLAAGAAARFLIPRSSIRVPPAVAGVLNRLIGWPAWGPGPAEVASAFEANARPFRACLQAARRGPRRVRPPGRQVDLFVTVAPSGRVTAPRLEETDLDKSPLGACLKSAARRMVFQPHSGAPVEVRIPLELGRHG